MPVEQTKDVLDHMRLFHSRVSQYYHRLADSTQRVRVKLLLDYMSEHERRLAESLEDYEETASPRILKTWLKSGCTTDASKLLEDEQLVAQMPVEEVVQVGVRLSECAISIYEHLANYAEPESIRQVFQNLLDMEQEALHQFVRAAGRLEDI